MKSSNILEFTFITFIVMIFLLSLFFSNSNFISLNNIAYGILFLLLIITIRPESTVIDKIAIKVTEAKPSADYVSVKKVIEGVESQKHNKRENVQESLTNILNLVSQNPESIVVDNIVNLAIKESASNTQQQD